MKNPTQSQWNAVIADLEKCLPYAKLDEQLDMAETRVHNNFYACNSVHCVAGWYATQHIDDCENIYNTKIVSYHTGADLLSKNLGFDERFDLADWAEKNPEIWGNEDGDDIFYDTCAYNGAKNLKEVVEYLKGVRDRSPK